MKITYETQGRGRLKAYVWHNGEEHIIAANEPLELKVARGDVIKWRIGRFTATHTLAYQSRDAEFALHDSRQGTWFLAGLSVVILILAFSKLLDNTWLTVVVLLGLLGYEAFNFFAGWTATPRHK